MSRSSLVPGSDATDLRSTFIKRESINSVINSQFLEMKESNVRLFLGWIFSKFCCELIAPGLQGLQRLQGLLEYRFLIHPYPLHHTRIHTLKTNV